MLSHFEDKGSAVSPLEIYTTCCSFCIFYWSQLEIVFENITTLSIPYIIAKVVLFIQGPHYIMSRLLSVYFTPDTHGSILYIFWNRNPCEQFLVKCPSVKCLQIKSEIYCGMHVKSRDASARTDRFLCETLVSFILRAKQISRRELKLRPHVFDKICNLLRGRNYRVGGRQTTAGRNSSAGHMVQ